MGTVFLSILNQMEFHLVQNRKENRHHDHIPFTLNENIVFSVQVLAVTPAADAQYAVTVRQDGTAPYTPKRTRLHLMGVDFKHLMQ